MNLSCRLLVGCLLIVCTLLVPAGAAAAAQDSGAPTGRPPTSSPVPSSPSHGDPAALWRWPLPGPRIVSVPYRAPAHEYGAGHRGIDITAATGAPVSAPASGVVAFRGTVVDRPLITIEHPGGFVSTLEPVTSSLDPGAVVSAGQPIGTVATGGHAPTDAVHLGVRQAGVYIDPMLMFGPVQRAVLLPCCDAR